MSKPSTEFPPFEKEVIHLPDGRELTYYRFPEGVRPPAAGKGPRPSPPSEER